MLPFKVGDITYIQYIQGFRLEGVHCRIEATSKMSQSTYIRMQIYPSNQDSILIRTL